MRFIVPAKQMDQMLPSSNFYRGDGRSRSCLPANIIRDCDLPRIYSHEGNQSSLTTAKSWQQEAALVAAEAVANTQSACTCTFNRHTLFLQPGVGEM